MKESTSGKSSQDKVRLTLPRRRIGFSADALIPGSVSSMMGSIANSETDEEIPDVIASPSFQNFLECDASSDYETDLEEDFPGNSSLRQFKIFFILFTFIMKKKKLLYKALKHCV